MSVSVEPADGRHAASFDYELTVEAQGDAAGAPTYSSDDFDEPFRVGRDAFSTVASGNPAPQDADGATSGSRRFTALGLGAFGLVCCALGALQLRRR